MFRGTTPGEEHRRRRATGRDRARRGV